MKFKSLKFYLLFILIPSLLFFILFYHGVSTINDKQIREQARKENAQQSNAILIYFLQLEMSLEEIGRAINFYGQESENELLKLAKARLGVNTEIYLTSNKGTIINSTEKESIGYDLSNTENVKKIYRYKKSFTSKIHLPKLGRNFEKNIVIVPILTNSGNIDKILFATFNIEQTLKNELVFTKTINDLLLLNEFNDPIFGNEDLLNHNNTYTYELMNNKWKLHYIIPDVPTSDNIFAFLISFVLSFLVFHLIYAYLLFRDYKQQEKLNRLEFIELFAAGVAHEIKNPLTAIKGFIKIIEEGNMNQNHKKYFDIIKKEIDQINQLSSEFLVLGKPIFVEDKLFLIQDCFKTTIELLINEAAQKNVLIEKEIEKEEIYLVGNYKHINQVLLNLGKNAIEASLNGDKVSLKLKKINKNKIRIEVKDQGSGIKNEDIDKIFIPFHTTKASGTGLGMPICQKIIETYDGTIKVSSNEGFGTKIVITLPIPSSLSPSINEM